MTTLYSDIDHVHQPDDDPHWQESFVLVFRDLDSDLVGFLRLGSYVNQGQSQTHFGLALPDGTRFRRHRLDLPYDPAGRSRDRLQVGPLSWAIHEDHIHVTGTEDEAEVDVRLYDFFPSQNWRIADPMGAEIAKGVGGMNHPESSGRIKGRVRLGDRVIDIANGLFHRDHAWGPRVHIDFLNNRWIAGTVGPELSFSCMTLQRGDGNFFKAAWVVRDGVVEYAQDVNTAAIVLADGLSTIGGFTEIILDSGERIVIETEVIDGIITSTHQPNGGPGSSPAGVEALAKARWNGLEGFCDFNININPLHGEAAVTRLLHANHSDGLTKHEPDTVAWAYRIRNELKAQ